MRDLKKILGQQTLLLCFKNRYVKYLLWIIDVLTEYAWVKILRDKKCKTALNACMEIVNESNH